MSKLLDGNGRWSTKFMSPEHSAALQQRHQQQPQTTMPTKEELEAIRDFVLLPMLLSIVEKNKQEIERTSYSMRTVFVKAANIIQNLMTNDLQAVRKLLKERNIKVFEDEMIDSNLRYKYICRGYEDKFVLIRDVARAELMKRLGKYSEFLK
ncbi:hypothetical protein BC351_32620 [Paenibacillus ferrarius]|uniref:Uncharacterized protein n=1 Tax=Paenibacillus ferrarius TaxID=1469647 RepID=A0A1V4HEQ3_9BACL|nr:hypothetical protein [Paenibacillus ferrarius]OPH53003.1 hypothetical protein BC351_32620 [Paenibacillus ferrarius]